MRIPIATDLKTRTGAPDKDARQKNCYVETKGDPNAPETAVRKRPAAQGGVSVSTGTAQGGIGFYIGSTPYFIGFWGDTLVNYVGNGTNWNSGTTYPQGSMVSYGFVNYWSKNDTNTNHNPTSSPTYWSTSTTYPIPALPGLSWTSRTMPVSNAWVTLCYSGTKYFACYSGYIYSSSDGITWTQSNYNSGTVYKKVVKQNTNIFAFGGFSGTSYMDISSNDGTSWSSTASYLVAAGLGAGDYFSDIAWNGTSYVATVNGLAYTATSTNGTTWTIHATTNIYNSIAWNGSIFVAVGNGKIDTSPDGITWTNQRSNAFNWNKVIWTGSNFATVAATYVGIAPDGVNWNFYAHNLTSSALDISFTNGVYMIVGNATTSSSRSTNGTSWSLITMPANQDWKAIATNGANFCAVGAGVGGSGTTISATTP